MHMIRIRRQMSGFTLISTLVGLAVGLLGIAAMLTMYHNVVNSAEFVKDQAFRDGQVATSSLVSQQEMQQAGFGITGATIGTDLVVLSNASLSNDGKLQGTAITSYNASVTGNAVIWGFNPTAVTGKTDPAGYQCEGLLVTAKGLLWLKPASCKNAANSQSVQWQSNQLATASSLGPLSIFQASSGSCFPYQQTTPGSSFQVSYYLPTQDQANNGQSNGPANTTDSSSSSNSDGSGDSNKWDNAGHRDGVHPGNGQGGGNSSGSSGSDGSSGSSGSSGSTDALSLPSSSSSTRSTSSAVINIPAFSVCLPNFKSQGNS
ncbi:PilW family protein [Dyella acidisoli]|uniref:Uncharacterized protein n=1 Tax=Dyella acidisoli TaxID=1867834 RepID=A0ABQ5XR08_9GAMM|nr:hypothetical protein [Dyella acidisoli]GLQ94181.1 hypothetical protein GCM10007901_31320 [Dyella acidisoli]